MPEFVHPTLADVLATHQDILGRYGGSAGVRDQGLLESALAQPQLEIFGTLLHPTIADQAAAYLFHVIKNHPFVDGNKRTAFTVCITFLAVNGFRLELTQNELFELILAVANDQYNKETLSSFLASVLRAAV